MKSKNGLREEPIPGPSSRFIFCVHIRREKHEHALIGALGKVCIIFDRTTLYVFGAIKNNLIYIQI